jgi:flagellar basal-body rod modification protein FlgD
LKEDDVMDAVTQSTVGTAAQKVTSAADKAAVSAASDFETFLKLLTTQMRNQDPSKPIDSTEFVAQLASFSAVEQQVATNKSLEAIETLLSGGGAGLAGWLGADVQAEMPIAWQGGPVEIQIGAPSSATRTDLVVRDATGATVHREKVESGKTSYTWDGSSGEEGGVYAFEIEHWNGDDRTNVDTGRVFAPVQEVRLEHGTPTLVFAGDVRIVEDDVVALRSAAK